MGRQITALHKNFPESNARLVQLVVILFHAAVPAAEKFDRSRNSLKLIVNLVV